MPNRHFEEVRDNQTRQIIIAYDNCTRLYGPEVEHYQGNPFYNKTSKSLMCSPFWDTLTCWPYIPAGELAIIPCPSYIAGFKTDFNATRLCTENGTWYVNETNNKPWANYTACMDGRITTIFTIFQKTNINHNYEIIVPTIKIISQTGYAVSFISLIVAFSIMLLIRRLHCARNILHMNLFASFMLRAFFYTLKDVLFIDGIGFGGDFLIEHGELYFKTDIETNNYECKILTSLVQYFTTASFSWILMEGLYLNNLILRALFTDSSKNIVHYICFGWGFPLVVIIFWIIARILFEDTTCWTMNDNLIPFLVLGVPTIISVLINLVLFVIISVVLYSKLQDPIREDTKRYKKWAKSTLVLVPLFGVHYAVFLVLYFAGEIGIWIICDILFGSFQGLFVAILYCFLNGEVKTEIKPYIWNFLYYLATHRFFAICFPCKEKFLRSAVGRHSVCTTMSCSSVSANGVMHRSIKSKWDLLQNGNHSLITDKGKDHSCNNVIQIARKTSLREFAGNNKYNSSSGSGGNGNDETTFCIEHRPEKNHSDSLATDDEICMHKKLLR